MSPLRPEERSEWEASAADETFHRTDAGNGEHFARLFGDRVRFDHRRRRWFHWEQHWWAEDMCGEVRLLAKEAARRRYSAAVAIGDPGERKSEATFAIGSENRSRIDAMLIAARSEPPIAEAGDRWDDDPWLLGLANGILDLRTGALRPGRAEDGITLHSDVAFDPDAACPRWEQFLAEIFSGDEELVDYIWRAIGYSLTGDVSEQCLFTCYGTGANGKSVFLSILRALAGSYAQNTPFTTFELHNRSSIPNDLAALAGRRLVTASETGEGTRLNEARMKALTGGDPVTARFLHGEFFDYQPVAKFWLAANHRPLVTDDSHGFWRRVRLIPFEQRFDPDLEPTLVDQLRAELPGIVAWAMRGALSWQKRGLRPVAAVRDATETYRAESDPLADFLGEQCVEGPALSVRASEVYARYRLWAGAAGFKDHDVLSNTAFGTRLTTRFHKYKANRGWIYDGLALRDPSIGASGDGFSDGSQA